MTIALGKGEKYIEPELRNIELSSFELRREHEKYNKKELEQDEEEASKFTSLVESIREVGILNPISAIIRGYKKYEVIDGGRRIRAAQVLDLEVIPTMLYEGNTDESEIRKRALIVNIHRKDLNNEEKGEGLIAYYKSGRVNPVHAVSYLNTLRQRKQIKDRNEVVLPTVGKTTQEGAPPGNNNASKSDQEDPAEYQRFLTLHKQLGIARMTQYTWLTYVVWTNKEIRRLAEQEELSKTERQLLIHQELRNNTDAQKSLIQDIGSFNKEISQLKARKGKEKLEAVKEEIKEKIEETKEKKEKKVSEYLPHTKDKQEKKQRNKTPRQIYGEFNGAIKKVWKCLTGIDKLPTEHDDIKLDYIKPSRQYFMDYLTGIGKKERILQYNELAYIEEAWKDRAKLYKDIDEKA